MYTEFNPQHLSDLVSAIWYSDSDVNPAEGHIAPPSLGAQLIIKIYRSHAETVLSGPVTQQKLYPFVEDAHYFGVQFAPNVGAVFDGVFLKDLKDSSVNINKVLGIDLTLLAHQLVESKSWTEQKTLLESTVSKKYPHDVRFLNQNVLFAINIANASHGNISIKKLATIVGVSKRHLERLFLHHTGLTPKAYCSTLRMQKVLHNLHFDRAHSLAHLALECGFTDQAHLANEFRRVMGTSILAYVAQSTGSYQVMFDHDESRL